MTETTGFPPEPAGQPELTPDQEAFLRAQQAHQAATSPSPAADQAASDQAMAQGGSPAAMGAPLPPGERGPLLPAEQQINDLMEALKAQSQQIEAMQGRLDVLHRAEEERVAAAGGPLIVRYAEAVKAYLLSHAVANPDLGSAVTSGDEIRVAGHFATPVTVADELLTAAKAYAKGEGGAQAVHSAADKLDRFMTRGHGRLTAKHVDYGAALQALEYVVDEASKAA